MARIEHVAVSVSDLDRERAFYEAAFGMAEEGRSEFADGAVRMAFLRSAEGAAVELVQRAGSAGERSADLIDAARRRGWIHLALDVADLDATLIAVVAAGGALVAEPAFASMRPRMRFAVVADPDGNLIEVIQR
jgi:catechol 2,3-dioxygenase-like lactoylglutathione lyase family enzyme